MAAGKFRSEESPNIREAATSEAKLARKFMSVVPSVRSVIGDELESQNDHENNGVIPKKLRLNGVVHVGGRAALREAVSSMWIQIPHGGTAMICMAPSLIDNVDVGGAPFPSLMGNLRIVTGREAPSSSNFSVRRVIPHWLTCHEDCTR